MVPRTLLSVANWNGRRGRRTERSTAFATTRSKGAHRLVHCDCSLDRILRADTNPRARSLSDRLACTPHRVTAKNAKGRFPGLSSCSQQAHSLNLAALAAPEYSDLKLTSSLEACHDMYCHFQRLFHNLIAHLTKYQIHQPTIIRRLRARLQQGSRHDRQFDRTRSARRERRNFLRMRSRKTRNVNHATRLFAVVTNAQIKYVPDDRAAERGVVRSTGSRVWAAIGVGNTPSHIALSALVP